MYKDVLILILLKVENIFRLKKVSKQWNEIISSNDFMLKWEQTHVLPGRAGDVIKINNRYIPYDGEGYQLEQKENTFKLSMGLYKKGKLIEWMDKCYLWLGEIHVVFILHARKERSKYTYTLYGKNENDFYRTNYFNLAPLTNLRSDKLLSLNSYHIPQMFENYRGVADFGVYIFIDIFKKFVGDNKTIKLEELNKHVPFTPLNEMD